MLRNPSLAWHRARARAAVVFVALLAGLVSVAGPAAPALAAPVLAAAEEPAPEGTLGISGEPLGDQGSAVRTRFSYHAAPGQELEDAYVVSNTGSTAQTFVVFATDAFNTEDGGYGLLDTGVAPSNAGAWVRFADEQSSVEVPLQPGESTIVPFTVRVPADASPGDHAGGIVISALAADGQVLMDRRVGTRLYIRVPGELQPNLTIAGMSSSYSPSLNPLAGETSITFTVRNAGNVALSGRLKSEVKGLFGIGLADPVEQELAEMLPGSTRTVTVVVPGVGQWLFLNPVVTITPEVDPGALNPGPLTSVTRDSILFVVPWVLVGLIAIGLAIWGWMWFSRRRDRDRARAWIEYTEAEARRKAEAEREPVGTAAGGAHRSES